MEEVKKVPQEPPEKPDYGIEKLPISKKTFKGLTPENIDMLGAVGRMMSKQDLFIEETMNKILEDASDVYGQQRDYITRSFAEQKPLLEAINTGICGIQAILKQHSRTIKRHESAIKQLKVRVGKIEERIEKLSA